MSCTNKNRLNLQYEFSMVWPNKNTVERGYLCDTHNCEKMQKVIKINKAKEKIRIPTRGRNNLFH